MAANGKLVFILLLSSLAYVTVAQNWWESGISAAITLANFEEYIGKEKHVVVEVFAQFCFYCKIMQPEWDRLAEHYMGENQNRKDVIVAKLDAGVEPALADRFGVNAFPAFLFFKKDDVFPSSRYNGERTAESFIQWTEMAAGPEEIAPPKEDQNDQDIFAVLDDTQKLEEIPQQDPNDIQPFDSNTQEIKDEDIDIIVQKLDVLVDLVNTNGLGEVHDQRGRDMNELRTLIHGIDSKLSNKVGPSGGEDINFAHGISFMLLGVFLGIGISFALINYQKLARSRKLKLLD